jgi:hypothetical protein
VIFRVSPPIDATTAAASSAVIRRSSIRGFGIVATAAQPIAM